MHPPTRLKCIPLHFTFAHLAGSGSHSSGIEQGGREKPRWSAKRKREARLHRQHASQGEEPINIPPLPPRSEPDPNLSTMPAPRLASGRLAMTQAVCAYCARSGHCEIDPDGTDSLPYCRGCWSQYERHLAHAERWKLSLQLAQRRDERANVRSGDREAASARRGRPSVMQLHRRQLFSLLLEQPAGVRVEELPWLLCPALRREGITWTPAELCSLCAMSADFASQQHTQKDGTGKGIVLRLAQHIRASMHSGPPCLPAPTPPRVLLILDLNHLLCERHPRDAPRPSEQELQSHAHTYVQHGQALVWERPYAASFIDWCMTRFTLALWSSGKRRNIEPIVRRLLTRQQLNHMLFIWGQEECTIDEHVMVAVSEADEACTRSGTHAAQQKPLIRKDLVRVWKRWPAWDPTCTVLVDDDPIKCSHNVANTAIHPVKWRALQPPEGSTDELAPHGSLCRFLGLLLDAEDTQHFMRDHPYYTTR